MFSNLRSHRFLPAILMSAVAAVPIVTAGEIIAHLGKTVAGFPSIPRRSSAGTHPRSTGTGSPHPTPTPQPTPVPHASNGTFTGGSYPDLFGYLSASITVSGGRITGVTINAPMDNPTSAYINTQAVPLLKSETLRAQSSNINVISGATATSQAFYYSLTDALKRAGL